ncbi:MAG: hypothetical protein DRP60_01285 [Spirochaetes bacterium]|nr:MAG: hypothetical protein DRP60_01285 [Spirochaetota bacterium]
MDELSSREHYLIGYRSCWMPFPAMNWEKLAELKDAGWAIGAHRASHVQLATLFETEGGLEKVDMELKTGFQGISANQ